MGPRGVLAVTGLARINNVTMGFRKHWEVLLEQGHSEGLVAGKAALSDAGLEVQHGGGGACRWSWS